MDRLTHTQKHALRIGLVGFLLIFLGLKFILQWGLKPHSSLPLDGQPVLLFFTLDDPCECMQELIQQAEDQIDHWPEAQRAGILIRRIDFDTDQDLAGQYNVFRVPCLVMLDSHGEVVLRQDYPLIEGGPLDLQEFEAHIPAELQPVGGER